MDCERSNQIHLYHDGELSAGERDALEAHLKACGECGALLKDLRAMSRMLAGAPMFDAPADAMNRIRAARYVMPDTGVLKIAGWLTTAAAAVLLAALPIWRQEEQDRTTVVPAVASADVLDTVAVNPPTDPETGRTDLIALAQWMSDDLSANERH